MQQRSAATESEERAKHLSAIQSISEQHRLPVADIAPLYERELASLKQEALITTYLSIFASRRVEELLHFRQRSPSPAATADAAGR